MYICFMYVSVRWFECDFRKCVWMRVCVCVRASIIKYVCLSDMLQVAFIFTSLFFLCSALSISSFYFDCKCKHSIFLAGRGHSKQQRNTITFFETSLQRWQRFSETEWKEMASRMSSMPILLIKKHVRIVQLYMSGFHADFLHPLTFVINENGPPTFSCALLFSSRLHP